jgi:hypothetical protein
MIDYKAAYAIAKQIKAYRATPGNAPQIIELLNRATGLFDNDAAAKEWLAREGLADLTDTYFRFREMAKLAVEEDKKRPSPARSSEVIERKPPPVQRAVKSSYSDFAHDFATENDRGRFAKINPFVTDVPRQPATSPWFHDPVPPEPPLGFSVNALPGQEQPATAPVTEERVPREEEWLGDIDRLLDDIAKRDAEIARLKAELKSQSSAAAPVQTPSVELALGGEGQPLVDPPHVYSPNTMDVTDDKQKEE